jgi:hypothetical protein
LANVILKHLSIQVTGNINFDKKSMYVLVDFGKESLIMAYLDNIDNECSNKYKNFLKIGKKIYRYDFYL